MNNKIEKELSEISWNVTEPEYRADGAISYSTLATYAREGIKGLKKLADGFKLDTPSLRHGSVVDTLLTDEANFDNLYVVANYNKPSDIIRPIIDKIWDLCDKSTGDLSKVDTNLILQQINIANYGGANWKIETKINKIIEEGKEYFQLLSLTLNGKKLVHQVDYDYALACVNTLKTNPFTSYIFDTFNPNIKIYYQLKFKCSFGGLVLGNFSYIDNKIERDFNGNWLTTSNNKLNPLAWKDQLLEEDTIRCMFDILLVDYDKKTIQPIDLKTTSHNEEDFGLSIQDWFYELQADEYSYILREIISQDEYFKHFRVLPFRFLPINKYNLSPQLYEYPESVLDIQQSYIDYKGITHLPWYEYLEDVRWHFKTQEFDYKKKTVENEGINYIRFKHD